jgi:hypothetical protein
MPGGDDIMTSYAAFARLVIATSARKTSAAPSRRSRLSLHRQKCDHEPTPNQAYPSRKGDSLSPRKGDWLVAATKPGKV